MNSQAEAIKKRYSTSDNLKNKTRESGTIGVTSKTVEKSLLQKLFPHLDPIDKLRREQNEELKTLYQNYKPLELNKAIRDVYFFRTYHQRVIGGKKDCTQTVGFTEECSDYREKARTFEKLIHDRIWTWIIRDRWLDEKLQELAKSENKSVRERARMFEGKSRAL